MKNKIDYDYIIKQAESCLHGNAAAFFNLRDYVEGLKRQEAKEKAKALFKKGQELNIIKRAWKVSNNISLVGKFYNVTVAEFSYVGASNNYQVFLMKPEVFEKASKGSFSVEENDNFLENAWNRNFGPFDSVVNVDIEALLEHISCADKKKPKPFIISVNEEKIGFNPFYLLDSIKFSETTEFYFVKKNAPVVFVGADKDCMLCPVYIK